MQTDGGLVENVEDSGRPVADCARELHPLPFSRGERGGGAVECQIPESEIKQAARRIVEGFTDVLRHCPHRRGQGGWNFTHPGGKFGKSHAACLIERNSAHERRTGRGGKTAASALRAELLLEEAFDAFHAAFVLDFRKGVFHGADGVVVGEIEFAGGIGILRLVENVFFDGGSVEDNVALLFGEFGERDIGADAHCAADVGHERPHERVPGGDGSVVDGERFIGNERRAVNRPHNPGPVAFRTGSLTVECELFG